MKRLLLESIEEEVQVELHFPEHIDMSSLLFSASALFDLMALPEPEPVAPAAIFVGEDDAEKEPF